MAPKESMNLREWRPVTAYPQRGRLFTCGRPGRATFGRAKSPVGDDIIDLWVKGLPESEVLHIVSLLGEKTTGFSEFGYYPFRSSTEFGNKPTFQEWLDKRYGSRFVVHEFPTVDGRGIPQDLLDEVKRHALDLVENGNTVRNKASYERHVEEYRRQRVESDHKQKEQAASSCPLLFTYPRGPKRGQKMGPFVS